MASLDMKAADAGATHSAIGMKKLSGTTVLYR